jgi:hypothetical protein
MAQEETVHLLATDIPQPVPQSTHFPHKTKPSGANGGPVETASQSSGTSPGPCQENAVINHVEIEDDEVQFVFSLPRRKRKKRKGYYDLSFSSWLDSDQLHRVESPYKSSIVRQDSGTSASPRNSIPGSTPMSPQRLRRGSTGTVRQLELCHMSGDIQTSMKGGSLPTLAQIQKPHLPSCQSVSSGLPDVISHSAPSLPFADGTPWWDVQMPLINGNGSFQFDVCGMPFAEEIFKKRKHDEDPQDSRLDLGLDSGHEFTQSPQNKRLATDTGHIFAHAGKTPRGMNGVSLDTIANSRLKSSACEAQTRTTLESTIPKTISSHKLILPQNLPTISRDMCALHQSRELSQQHTSQKSCSGRQLPFDWRDQQPVQVPVSLVPEISVSPRTKTVQVFRPVSLNQSQFPKTLSQCSEIPRTTALHRMHGQSAANTNPQSTQLTNLNSYGVDPSTPVPVSSLQSTPRDIIRKPSLYKIPPWPSPPVSQHQPQCMGPGKLHMRKDHSKNSPQQAYEAVSKNAQPSVVAESTKTQQIPLEEIRVKSGATGKIISTSSGKVHAHISHPAAATAQPHAVLLPRHQRLPNMTTSFDPSPHPVQTSQATRKRSPNL